MLMAMVGVVSREAATVIVMEEAMRAVVVAASVAPERLQVDLAEVC